MWGKPDLGAFHKQITIPDFLGFLLSHTLRLQWKSGWSSCKKVNVRILIHSNTDVWLSKYFYQTRSLGFIFVILPFHCWWQSHGSEWPAWMPQSRTNQAINPKSCVVSLPAKLFDRRRCLLRRHCSEWRLFGRQDMEKTQKFHSLFPQSQSGGSHAQRSEQGSGASSPETEINEVQHKAQQEFRECTVSLPLEWSLADGENYTYDSSPIFIPSFRNQRKQVHLERFIKNTHHCTNRKYCFNIIDQ